MQTRTVKGANHPPSRESVLVEVPEVPQRSARRATARRASNRRATARRRQDNVESLALEYLKEHPQSTTGDMAKGLNADRGTIAAGVLHLIRARAVTRASNRYEAK